MIPDLDATHDPARRSWVAAANDPSTDFPIQNLPLGVFSPAVGSSPRIGVAIGDHIVDLAAVSHAGLIRDVDADVLAAHSLNALFAGGLPVLKRLRDRVGDLLDAGIDSALRERLEPMLYPMAKCRMHCPTQIGDYTDFYAGIHHARAAGALLTPDNPLPANYKWVPIAYHGRASSVMVSGAPVCRPRGQRSPAPDSDTPKFGPTKRLDLELEMGLYMGPGNALGEPIAIDRSVEHIMGYSLLNDWSARDIQGWEMFPLGPFLAKSFATAVSPWVVTPHALAPFRVPATARPSGDPAPLAYLYGAEDGARGGLSVSLEVMLSTIRMRDHNTPPVPIISSNARHLYWTPAQMVAHHTVNGCNMRPGDLIGTGTISGPTDAELSSLLELTAGGRRPVTLPNGEQRYFLEDGDEITLRGRCEQAGCVAIGFGECRSRIMPAWEY